MFFCSQLKTILHIFIKSKSLLKSAVLAIFLTRTFFEVDIFLEAGNEPLSIFFRFLRYMRGSSFILDDLSELLDMVEQVRDAHVAETGLDNFLDSLLGEVFESGRSMFNQVFPDATEEVLVSFKCHY